MCTVVCRWQPDAAIPVQILALRDEVVSRVFDRPARWWPGQPAVVGGRDRSGGGTWCATDVARGATAVVLNRPERRIVSPGVTSRGALPLAALAGLDAAGIRSSWAESIDLSPMASFNLVMATPRAATWWSFDGISLRATELTPGTSMFTPQGRAERLLDARFGHGGAVLAAANTGAVTATVWPQWLPILSGLEPSENPQDLLVRRPVGNDVYATVFGQFIASRPGWLRLDQSRSPDQPASWSTSFWGADQVTPVDAPGVASG